jgi:hypothetical protein
VDADAPPAAEPAQEPSSGSPDPGPTVPEDVAAGAGTALAGPVEAEADVAAEPAPSRRSDRWEAGAPEGRNPWAWLSAVFGLLGVTAVVVVGMATSNRAPFEDLPDRAAYVLFAAVPSFGVLALMSGLTGRNGSRGRWLAWTGLVLGALLALGALAVTIVLITALRTLG